MMISLANLWEVVTINRDQIIKVTLSVLFSEILIHLHNYDKDSTYTISNLVLNGKNVDSNVQLSKSVEY